MRYETFLFDLDGTLIDSIELIRRSYAHTLRAHLGLEVDREHWLEGLGRPLVWQFARYVSAQNEIEAMIATYREHNFAHHDAMVKAFDGVPEVLRELRARGARLGIVTSKTQYGAQRGLRHCGIADLFEAVVGCDDVREPKPHAEPALRALEILGARAEQSVMVGDSPHDLDCGRGAGARTAAVTWGPFPRARLAQTAPDHWLERPEDLAQLAPAR